MKAALVLEDGSVFEGVPFGAPGEASGETVLYTGVVGYPEVLTDTAFRRTLVVMTYPIIGAYGVNSEDGESPQAQAQGIVVREHSPYYSNWRAKGSLEDFLKDRGIVGIREVDTRAVAVHLREKGEMRGAIASGDVDVAAAARKLREMPSPYASDLVREVTGSGKRDPRGAAKHRVAVLDLGVKRSLLDQLAALGCAVEILRADAPAGDVLAGKPDRVVAAGGPGDPRVPAAARETLRGLLGKVPVLGVGLGCEVLALALGCAVRRLKLGHRGMNQSVREPKSGNCLVTSQTHGFAVEEKVPASVEVTHVNLNDGTVEGIRSQDHPASGIEFNPSPDEMERPSPILARFLERGHA
jgi:carbamoyl-phosphate synthase small subunit